MRLPTAPEPAPKKDPLRARVLLIGTPKAGKTTLFHGWSPQTSLFIDTHRGTEFLEPRPFVQHVHDWDRFVQTVDLLASGDHQFRTVALDLVDDIWNMCDKAFAGRGAPLASATNDYSRSIRAAEGTFRDVIGRLLATNLGVWFLTNAREKEENGITRYVPQLAPNPLAYVRAMVSFIWCVEAIGPKRQLHTAPNARFESGGRVPLPSPMEPNARELYRAMNTALNPTTPTEAKAA